MTLLKRLMLATAAVAFTGFVHAADPLKVGFVYVSPIGDAGWTYMHDQARKKVQEEFGDRIETTYVESVAEGADSERVIRNMASRGYDLIFTTSFGYMNPTLKVAARYPNVKFEHATGYKTAKNVGVYEARDYEGRYLAGMIAGAMSKNGVIGYVGAFPIPEVIRGINAFMLGAQQTRPDASIKVVWINSWHDPAKEREAAESLILQKADVLTMHSDSAAVIQTAEANKVYAVGFNSDMSAYGPNAHLTAATQHWDGIYREKIQAVLDNNWEPKKIWYGLKEGASALSPIHKDVPETVIQQVEAAKQAIINGERSVFSGPIFNQAGEQIVGEGKAMTDDELHALNWYVKGVEGRIPK